MFHNPPNSEEPRGFTQPHRAGAGFTLLEIVLVLAAMALLVGIVVSAMNPN